MNNCFGVIAQVFSKIVVNVSPFCYSCFDYSYREKLEFNRFISLNRQKPHYFFMKGGTPNLVARFVFFRIVVCSNEFISSCLTFTKCKAVGGYSEIQPNLRPIRTPAFHYHRSSYTKSLYNIIITILYYWPIITNRYLTSSFLFTLKKKQAFL